MTCYIFIYLNRDMVRGGRSRRVSTSVGRGSASPSTPWTASPSTPIVPTTGTASPTTPVAPPFPSSSPPEVESQHPVADDEGPQLPGRQPCWISGGKIDLGSTSRYITTLVHAHIPGLVDAWREFPVPVWDLLYDMFILSNFISKQRRYAFTRPEDLPRARAVWESTAQTNLRKSMYEARDKAMKTTGSRDPTETYDRTMADRYAEGTPQLDLYPEVWVDAAGGPRKGRVYGFGDSLDTTPVLSSYASSVAPLAYASSSTAPPGSGVEDIRTLIREELREELRMHFGVMVEQLISAMQGVRPSQPDPQAKNELVAMYVHGHICFSVAIYIISALAFHLYSNAV
ncbi:hypothetical protein Taro_017234 [Colocasia esculenta]|uniref:Uncharacterized protein n=1 Tax=Colocasia esculenta TaxID=4460 RepID=A0A843USP7_COLES|nr:hypothetical protein [Colocasia esculenta]